MENKVSLNELSEAMEKMYHRNDQYVTHLSQMITVAARLAGIDPAVFARELSNLEQNESYADDFNKVIKSQNNK